MCCSHKLAALTVLPRKAALAEEERGLRPRHRRRDMKKQVEEEKKKTP
jgi:hypothetical protein